jgi:AcrR family transcriptional regulator
MRERILHAAEQVVQAKGVGRATTKEIARAAGVSEGSIYNYFESKEALFLSVFREQLPDVIGMTKALPGRAGQGRVDQTLSEVARGIYAFYSRFVIMASSAFANPEMLGFLRKNVFERGLGPHRANGALAAYLRAEQALGRIRPDADAEAMSDFLFGACFQQAFYRQFLGETVASEEPEAVVTRLVAALIESLGLSDLAD